MLREPEWWYRAPGLTARALGPVAGLYGGVAARRLETSRGYRSKLPVICVGNFTAGGSGKTPFSAMLVQLLVARGERPVVLTRGYGGTMRGPHWVEGQRNMASEVGDEPLLLAAYAPVMVARDRRAGAQAIEASGKATVIVMDDGLQNGALVKDLGIAIVDGARGVGNGLVIPAGPLRVPLKFQGPLVQAIVFNGPAKAGLAQALAVDCPAPQLTARLEPACDVAWLKGQRIVAFAGIGNPARFFDMLAGLGAVVVERVAFGDHAAFSDADAGRLLALAARHEARLITTSKDHVRLQGRARLDALAAATATLPVAMTLASEDRDALMRMLDRVLMR
ncbi:MAG: tetraacyldisaccharide 4'-kinase [Hyphomicrobiaceae bacterium]